MIKRFRKDPQLAEWQGIIERRIRKSIFMRFSAGCIQGSLSELSWRSGRCPRGSDDTLWQNQRGISTRPYKISGVIGVGMPIDVNLEQDQRNSPSPFLSGWCRRSSLSIVIISTFFNRYIAGNLRKILSFFRTNIKDEEGRSIFDTSQKMDEIDELIATAKTIADHIHLSQTTLEHYAEEILRSKNLLQSVFDGITDPVVLIGRKGRSRWSTGPFSTATTCPWSR